MDMNFAIGILDAVTRENITETGDLVEIQEEFTPEALAETIQNGINDIRAHHVRMERRSRRSCRW